MKTARQAYRHGLPRFAGRRHTVRAQPLNPQPSGEQTQAQHGDARQPHEQHRRQHRLHARGARDAGPAEQRRRSASSMRQQADGDRRPTGIGGIAAVCASACVMPRHRTAGPERLPLLNAGHDRQREHQRHPDRRDDVADVGGAAAQRRRTAPVSAPQALPATRSAAAPSPRPARPAGGTTLQSRSFRPSLRSLCSVAFGRFSCLAPSIAPPDLAKLVRRGAT